MDNNDPSTEKQVALLVQLGFSSDSASALTVSQARQLIQDELRKPTIKQRIRLLKMGVPVATIETLSKDEAFRLIADLWDQKHGGGHRGTC